MKQIKSDIIASLYCMPCSFEDLVTRDFLQGKSENAISYIVMQLQKDKKIYQRGDILFSTKKAAMELIGYEL